MGVNQSWVTEFVLVGFQLSAEMEVLLFWIFSLLYIFSLLANGMILGLICLDHSLHTPMYFFLSHLAVIDMSYASNNVPKMLANLSPGPRHGSGGQATCGNYRSHNSRWDLGRVTAKPYQQALKNIVAASQV